jgi:hypothetical protein
MKEVPSGLGGKVLPYDGIDRTKVVIYWLVQVDIDYTPEWHFFNSVQE